MTVCCSVMSDSLQPHGLQHARLPCPLLSPGACSNSCPLNPWSHPTISSSVAPFSPCPQSFPASGFFFPMSWLFSSGGQSIGASALALVLPMSIQDWFALGLGVWSPCCSGDSQESFPAPHSKASILWCSAFFMVHFSHHYMTTGKSINLTIWTFVGKVMSLLLNILSKFVIAFQMMVYCD